MLSRLREKGMRYWIIAAVLIAIGTFLGDWLGGLPAWVSARYRVYWILQGLAPHPPHAKRTALVVIGDAEYWQGELGRRVPIKRNYLARLLRKLDAADPALIALDFDLRSPSETLIEHPDYVDETTEFITAVKAVSLNRTIVLSRSIHQSVSKNEYSLEHSIYDGNGLDPSAVRAGYIQLPFDIRQIPLMLNLEDGSQLDSFSGAVVRAVDEKALEDAQSQGEDSLPYGSYMKAEDFPQFSAAHVLEADPGVLKSKLKYKIVIVGAAWHRNAFERGEQVDMYQTPMGMMGGLFIHANYVETLLDSRTYKPLPESIGIGVEVILSAVIAMIFALDYRSRSKVALLGFLSLALLGFAYVSWQNLGLFFDFFVPSVLLISHAAVEQTREWRLGAREAAELRERNSELLRERGNEK